MHLCSTKLILFHAMSEVLMQKNVFHLFILGQNDTEQDELWHAMHTDEGYTPLPLTGIVVHQ